MSTLTLIFGAGEKKQVPGGTLFLLLESVDPVNLQFNKANTTLGGAINGVKGGFKVGPFDRARAFDWVEIESATAQTIKVFVTDIAEADYNTISGNVTISGSIVSAAGSNYGSVVDVSLPAGVTTNVVTTNVLRKEIVVTSLVSNNAVLRLGDISVAANRGFPLSPGDSISLPCNAALYAHNTGVGAQLISILSISN